MDLLIYRFREALVELFNKTPIPMEVKRMVLNELMEEVNKKVQEMLAEQIEAENCQKESEVANNGNTNA